MRKAHRHARAEVIWLVNRRGTTVPRGKRVALCTRACIRVLFSPARNKEWMSRERRGMKMSWLGQRTRKEHETRKKKTESMYRTTKNANMNLRKRMGEQTKNKNKNRKKKMRTKQSACARAVCCFFFTSTGTLDPVDRSVRHPARVHTRIPQFDIKCGIVMQGMKGGENVGLGIKEVVKMPGMRQRKKKSERSPARSGIVPVVRDPERFM